MKALVNCDVFTGSEFLTNNAVLISDGKITGLPELDKVPDNAEIIDLGGNTIAPGFIDVQVNGGGGLLFNDSPTVETIQTIVQAHRNFGTTNLLPTFITGSYEGMCNAQRSVNECIENGLHEILGIHFEGPCLAEGKAGVHDKNFIRKSHARELDLLVSKSSGKKLFTLSPDQISGEEVRYLASKGVKLSLGHTNAGFSDCEEAVENGVTGVTHLYNAMSQLLSREPGVVGAAFVIEKLKSGIIVDGFHCDFNAVKIAWNAVKKGNLFLVTDAMPPVGAMDSSFILGPYEISVQNGKCVTSDGVLGGSALDMASAVRNCIQKVGIPKSEALKMASLYPATFLGLEQEYGSIQVGRQANLVVINNQIIVKGTFVAGDYRQSTN
ncbi:N-acetylglucosamine-6-phosphate deacetylase [Glaciecola sp. SC05]|uniref:N-acetylglucosamine-6-phosphate deacetylase n=1 Tax=Glaciecola sp. SC05 TaxID=1987355 RepID=UPI00352974D2